MACPGVPDELTGRLSRPPLERMLQIHQRLKAERFPNCRKLADELEVSAKTIQRDIEFMRDRLGLPIEYDAVRFGFHYTEPVAGFPSIEVSEGEIVALFVAQKALAHYEGTSFEAPLRKAFKKISDGLQETISFRWQDVDSAISFRGAGGSIADIALFETISKAVLRSHELEFEYRKLEGARFEPRRVQGYHIACVENQWYLFGFDLGRKQLRTFALTRMRKVRTTAARFRRPADFSIGKHLGESFGVFSGSRHYRVRIEFDELAGRLICERHWHPSQKIRRLAGGRIELILKLNNLREVERWILSWGGHARAREPEELLARLRETVGKMGGIYI